MGLTLWSCYNRYYICSLSDSSTLAYSAFPRREDSFGVKATGVKCFGVWWMELNNYPSTHQASLDLIVANFFEGSQWKRYCSVLFCAVCSFLSLNHHEPGHYGHPDANYYDPPEKVSWCDSKSIKHVASPPGPFCLDWIVNLSIIKEYTVATFRHWELTSLHVDNFPVIPKPKVRNATIAPILKQLDKQPLLPSKPATCHVSRTWPVYM